MDPKRREALEAAGFRVGDAEEFLGLTDEERQIVDLRVKLARNVRRLREAGGLAQTQLAARMATSQPRIARIEAAAEDVSLDQMFRALFSLGGTLDDLARVANMPGPAEISGARAGRRRKSAPARGEG